VGQASSLSTTIRYAASYFHSTMIVDDNILEIRNLSVTFGRLGVLRDITLDIPRGQTLAIIGESGCGKTVLLKSIIGLIRPNQGSVHFDGRDINELEERELARQRVRFGYVFQNAALFDSMTVAQNVAFPVRQHKRMPIEDVEKVVVARLAEVGLPESVITKKPAELSGGMRKRVGLARALVMNPEVLLYDEPTTGLDPIMSDVINELIMRTRSRYPVTSIVVTHDMKTAQKVADRIVMVYPLARLRKDDPQVLYDGLSEHIESTQDHRVRQFVRGEAGERLMEMRAAGVDFDE
jgi:phospholipid/cholesterol/gamma-HCH transport system ATP-binding protein